MTPSQGATAAPAQHRHPPPRRAQAHRLHWSAWRRRHQHRARQAHQRWNAYAETTPCLQRRAAAPPRHHHLSASPGRPRGPAAMIVGPEPQPQAPPGLRPDRSPRSRPRSPDRNAFISAIHAAQIEYCGPWPPKPRQPGGHDTDWMGASSRSAGRGAVSPRHDRAVQRAPGRGREVAGGSGGWRGDRRQGQAGPGRGAAVSHHRRARVRGGQAHPRPGDRPRIEQQFLAARRGRAPRPRATRR